jgi:hypothetical protein
MGCGSSKSASTKESHTETVTASSLMAEMNAPAAAPSVEEEHYRFTMNPLPVRNSQLADTEEWPHWGAFTTFRMSQRLGP